MLLRLLMMMMILFLLQRLTVVLVRTSKFGSCPVHRWKIAVCWTRSSLQIGSRCGRYPPFSFFQSPLNWEWRSVLASVSAEPDCWVLQVCLLFCFLSVPPEQAPTGGILETELSARHRSAGPGSSSLDQLSCWLVGLTRSQWIWRHFPFVSHSLTGALQLCKWLLFQLDSWSSEGHQEPRGKWCHHLGISAAATFHSFLSRPVSVDMSPDIVRESVHSQGKGEVSGLSRELFLWGDDWDTQKHLLYICLFIGSPGRICH